MLCSSAIRTRETLERLQFDDAPVLIEEQLYGAGAGALLGRVSAVPSEVQTLVVIAHNPGIEDLAHLLAEADDRLAAAGKFPTAAVADLEFATAGRSGARRRATPHPGPPRALSG